jgi:hypothetical protein
MVTRPILRYHGGKWRAMKEKKSHTFYAACSTIGIKPRKTFLMHRVIMNAVENEIIDHRDHDGLNNLKNNLRRCSYTQNQQNKSSRKKSVSKYLGVSYRKNRFIARIKVLDKCKHLGSFIDEIDAAKAYDEAAKKYHGEFANPNFKTIINE